MLTRLQLQNWRNFVAADIAIGERLFVVGPNASGKSNLLDAFRFLRDIAKTGGGLQQAVRERSGGDPSLSKIRCLAARRDPIVGITIELTSGTNGSTTKWQYGVKLRQEPRAHRRVVLTSERVLKNGVLILNRPDADDEADPLRLTQTHLEQIGANKDFRPIADALQDVVYVHLVPQLLKHPYLANRDARPDDPFGIQFLERILKTPEKTRRARLKKIQNALSIAVPELANLTDTRDEVGDPHLEAVYQHWRPGAGRQREDQFSDGTLRLIGLLWAILEDDALLLLEEPELSLHAEIVKRLPGLLWRLQQQKNRQVILSSHSGELLGDRGIRPEEVLILEPRGSEGTRAQLASGLAEVRNWIDGGGSLDEVVVPLTAPPEVSQLSLFG